MLGSISTENIFHFMTIFIVILLYMKTNNNLEKCHRRHYTSYHSLNFILTVGKERKDEKVIYVAAQRDRYKEISFDENYFSFSVIANEIYVVCNFLSFLRIRFHHILCDKPGDESCKLWSESSVAVSLCNWLQKAMRDITLQNYEWQWWWHGLNFEKSLIKIKLWSLTISFEWKYRNLFLTH